jgi:hypothetical protein
MHTMTHIRFSISYSSMVAYRILGSPLNARLR